MHYLRFRQAIRLALVGCLVLSAAVAAIAQTGGEFDTAVGLAKGYVASGRNREALVEAEKSIRMNPSRFEGHYYAAIALLRQNLLADADKYGQQALRLAPEDRRKEVEGVASTIRLQLQVLQKEEKAEEARAAGRIFLAATLYLEGFELDPVRADLGLNGARLWLTLHEPGRAARIYRRLALGADTAVRAEATRQLHNLAPALADEWSNSTTNGWRLFDSALKVRPPAQLSLEVAIEAFERAIDAFPDASGPPGAAVALTDSPYIGLAAAQAARGNRRSLEAALTRGAQNGLRPDSSVFFAVDRACTVGCRRYDAFAPYICQSDFEPFLYAMYGPPGVRAVKTACGTRQAQPEALMMDRPQTQEPDTAKVKQERTTRHKRKALRKHRRLHPAIAEQMYLRELSGH
jgi:tetratricopeptide (TPR) repeat protein